MRTTVDLPPALHRRVRELAESRGQSLSSLLGELAARGLSQLDEPLSVTVDERSGFPVVHVGRTVTNSDVAKLLDDE